MTSKCCHSIALDVDIYFGIFYFELLSTMKAEF